MWQRILTLIIPPPTPPPLLDRLPPPQWVGWGWCVYVGWGGGGGLNRRERRGRQQLLTQSFANQATWASTLGFPLEAPPRRSFGGGIRRDVMRIGTAIAEVVQGGGGGPTPLSSSPTPVTPPTVPSFLLVYISPKDVIELNKAFLRGSCHSCCLWHVKRPATWRALTYAPN